MAWFHHQSDPQVPTHISVAWDWTMPWMLEWCHRWRRETWGFHGVLMFFSLSKNGDYDDYRL